MKSSIEPDCSKWNIWEGPEIEGVTDINKMTLFVRKGNPTQYYPKYDRVWFCKEFVRDYSNFEYVQEALDQGKHCCIEITVTSFWQLPDDFREKCQLYLKIDTPLKAGDHVCVGTRFADEGFMVGDGAKVIPEQYAGDRRIE